jgi:hypothetical protein
MQHQGLAATICRMFDPVTCKFKVGNRVHNKQTNDHGKVTSAYIQGGHTMYKVSVPIDPYSWVLGGVEVEWPESDLEA